ncbi:MAG: Acyl-CoA dehydrogenase, partial [uncultured Solirubrobacteraceae bacterium]
EDGRRRGLRRLHPLHRRHGHAGRDPREEAREARHARVGHRAARLLRRPRPRDRGARPGRQGLLPHHVGAPGGAPDRRRGLRRGRPARVRQDAAVRARAPGVRPPDRQVPGHPPQVRRDGDPDRVGAADGLHDGLALRERRVPRARDLDGQAPRRAHRRRGRRRVHPDPRRRGLHEGVRDRARVARPAPEPHRRRHGRDHARRDRAVVRAL